MLKISLAPSLAESSLKENTSPQLPPSSKPSLLSLKKNFKSNSSAAFLRKKFNLTPTSQNDSEQDPQPTEQVKKPLNSDLRQGDMTPNEDLETTASSEKVFEISDEEVCLPQKFYRVMVIGSRNIGKRSFVQGLFSSDIPASSSEKQAFDLITKTRTDGALTKRYDFYLKEQDETMKNYKSILDVYYQTCSVVFLMCDEDCGDSLQFIEKELENLKNAQYNSNNTLWKKHCKQSIVLVASKAQRRASEACSEKLNNLREQYGIQLCFERDGLLEKKESIFNAIENLD